jgi:Protein of unknown function (DUF2568)
LAPIQLITLILRVTMEAGIVAGLAYWGVHAGSSTATKLLLGIGAPAVGFGIWGAVDFHQAGHGEHLRLIEELAISLVAAAALWAADQHTAGLALGVLTIAYHALVYATGGTLLEQEPATRSPT